ncbi:MAG: alginate export family protein [Armatimonadetes bacterium]|nr:alginate export family protein [Armatimonadota bacterium]MCA1996721.1 alginate export family protein [Armatimonadota bacterium]
MFGFVAPDHAALAVKPFLEIRSRYERRTDRDFDEDVQDNRSHITDRVRIGVDLKYGEHLSGRLQYRYGHEWIWTPLKNHSKERSDVEEAYLSAKLDGGATVKAGRQFVNKGAHLLVSTATFGNVAYSWEGVRFQKDGWDVFAGECAIDPAAEHANKWIAFAAKTWELGETMLLYHQREAPVRDVEVWTLDHRYLKSFGDLRVEAEAAVQTGHNQSKDLRAWAGRVKVCRDLKPQKATVYLDAYAASGGSNADKTFTFDMVAGSLHALFGQMDLQGWRNVEGLTLGVLFKPHPALDFCLEYHRFGLFDKADGWYGAGGGLNKGAHGAFLDPTGRSGRDVGQEFNLTGNYKLSKSTTLNFGVGLFQPGAFVKAFAPDSHTDQFWGYAGLTWKM